MFIIEAGYFFCGVWSDTGMSFDELNLTVDRDHP